MILKSVVKQLRQPSFGERVEISDKLKLYSLSAQTFELTTTRMNVIKELFRYADEAYRFNAKDSAKYAFNAGNSTIEIDIEVHNNIYITPYICYDKNHVKEDFERLIQVDRWLYAWLNQNELQK
jgi:hypothetical protein